MAIIILLVCFIAVFLNVAILIGPAQGKKEAFICSVLIFGLLIVLITELLSAFNLLSFNFILIAWCVVALLNIIYLYIKNEAVFDFITFLKQRAQTAYTVLNRYEKFLLCAVLLILTLVFIQGIIYPPNNWDSMCYHMARITSWVSHKSVADYPTPIFYQLYQPPFAEYVILHFDALGRGDYFSNSVQFGFFLFSLVTIAAIVKSFGLGRRYQIMAIVLAATIPEVVLQASSTQNDIVVSFFILTTYYFTFKIVKGQLQFANFLFLGLAAGLAFLTKATAYIYIAPVLPILGIYILTISFKTKNFKPLAYSLVVLLIAAGINAMHYYRNYNLSGNILGARVTDLSGGVNERMGPMLLLSSIEKNAGLQIGILGSVKPAVFANKVVYKLHAMEGLNINDPANSFSGATYSVPIGKANHEDYAANLFDFILIIASFVIICINSLKNKQDLPVKLLPLIIALQVILFCGYLKWQPWGSRLQVPIFMLAVMLICYAASVSPRFKKILNPVLTVILFYAFMLVLRNSTRPWLSAELTQPRYEKYFENRPYLYNEYQQVYANIHQLNLKNIGLLMGANDWQYPLFNNCFAAELNPVYINVKNISKTLPDDFKTVDCIVSTTINQAFIDCNGKRFYNQDGKNKYLYLYKQ